jgi:uncharacterized protein (TIGR03435 family)
MMNRSLQKFVLVCAAIAAAVTMNAPHLPAQSTPLSFEAATVKPAQNSGPMAPVGIRGTPGGRLSTMNTTLKMLVTFAYNVRDGQVSGGPPWMDSDRFDIEAKPETTATPDQVRLMMQTLLADRFNLKIHRESKEMNVYALTVAKGGPKMKLNDNQDDVRPQMRMSPGAISATAGTIELLLQPLSRFVGRNVVDKTGLTGRYDFELKWTPDPGMGFAGGPGPGGAGPPPPDPNGPSLFTAIQEQLGLKLDAQKSAIDTIVIDSAGKPSEN